MTQATTLIEGLIFISGDLGITLEEITNVTALEQNEIISIIEEIKNKHAQSDSALILVDYSNKYHFITKPECFETISKYLNVQKVHQLSQSALETLAIIAYKQPITRVEIEEIRGISCEIMLRKLLSLDLIKEAGRLDSPGRPILYEITPTFLETFKMVSLDELPEIHYNSEIETEDFYQ